MVSREEVGARQQHSPRAAFPELPSPHGNRHAHAAAGSHTSSQDHVKDNKSNKSRSVASNKGGQGAACRQLTLDLPVSCSLCSLHCAVSSKAETCL